MSNLNHSFRIAEQSGQCGFFCEVTLQISPLSKHELQILCESAEWKAAVEFGLQYAWEHIGAETRQGIAVRVLELHTHPVDSSVSVVAYASARCLMEAVGFTGVTAPTFQKEEARFCFAK